MEKITHHVHQRSMLLGVHPTDSPRERERTTKCYFTKNWPCVSGTQIALTVEMRPNLSACPRRERLNPAHGERIYNSR